MPELTEEQLEKLCAIAEKTARSCIYSNFPPKKIEKLNVVTETEGSKPTTLTVEIELIPLLSTQNIDIQRLVEEAIKESFDAAEKYLRNVSCQ
jgi:hypothetical protein